MHDNEFYFVTRELVAWRVKTAQIAQVRVNQITITLKCSVHVPLPRVENCDSNPAVCGSLRNNQNARVVSPQTTENMTAVV